MSLNFDLIASLVSSTSIVSQIMLEMSLLISSNASFNARLSSSALHRIFDIWSDISEKRNSESSTVSFTISLLNNSESSMAVSFVIFGRLSSIFKSVLVTLQIDPSLRAIKTVTREFRSKTNIHWSVNAFCSHDDLK